MSGDMTAMAWRSDYSDTDKVTLGVILNNCSVSVRLAPDAARKLAAELIAAADIVDAASAADPQVTAGPAKGSDNG